MKPIVISCGTGESAPDCLQTDPAWRQAAVGAVVCLLLAGTGLRLHQAPASMREALTRVNEVASQGRLAGGLVAVLPR